MNTPGGNTGANAPMVTIMNNVNLDKSKEDKPKPRTKEETKDK